MKPFTQISRGTRAVSRILAAAVFFIATPASALHPPTAEQLATYRADGSLEQRLARVKRLGNQHMAPHLIRNIRQRLAHSAKEDHLLPPLPPSATGGLPSTGINKAVVLLIDFPEYPHKADETVASFRQKMFGAGNPAEYPYESLRNFYQRSSYGKLTITGNVLGWYRAKHGRDYYENLETGAGQEELMKEALEYFDANGHDFSQYDNDGDGDIDALYVKWTGPDTGWGGFWWAVQSQWSDAVPYTVDGKKPNYYVSSWTSNPDQDGVPYYTPKTDIHETGHLLGLPDYYDYDEGVGPANGIGSLDMMDNTWGDHNCFSKFALNWLEPTVVSSGSQRIALKPSGTSPEAVLIMPKASLNRPFFEYYMVQYRKRGLGNDPQDYPNDGLLIWHVDARLNDAGDDFRFDNSYTSHKLLRLMEADGKEQIEQDYATADAGDFYRGGRGFGPMTMPSSAAYSGVGTGVRVAPLPSSADAIEANYRIVDTDLAVAAQPSTQDAPAGGFAFDAMVSNRGKLRAYAARLSLTLPAGATLADGGGAGCVSKAIRDGGSTVSCELGDIEVGSPITRRFVVQASTASVALRVNTLSYDVNQANNRVTAMP